MELYPHKSGIGLMEPVALINHKVCVIYGSVKNYRKVIYLEPIPPFQCLDIGVVGAATTTARTPCPNLELLDNEFGQFRWFPMDNVQVRLWIPQADGRMLLRNIQGAVDVMITDRDPCLHLTEFFVWEDYAPWFEAINFSAYPTIACRIVAQGYRYVTTELPKDVIARVEAGQEACTYVVASGSAGIPR